MTQFPHLHNNGSHIDDLMSPLSDTINALLDAEKALRECAPHGRDYYTISGTAIDTAMKEHIVRLKRIEDTIEELTAIRQNLSDQDAERRKARGQ